MTSQDREDGAAASAAPSAEAVGGDSVDQPDFLQSTYENEK